MMPSEQREAWIVERCLAIAKELDVEAEVRWCEQRGIPMVWVGSTPPGVLEIIEQRFQVVLDEANAADKIRPPWHYDKTG